MLFLLLKIARFLCATALLASAAIIVWPLVASCQTEEPKAAAPKRFEREDVLKAFYLHNFSRYIRWPDAGDHKVIEEKKEKTPHPQPFVLGVLGPDPVADILDEIANDKKVARQSIVVKRFATMDDYTPCQVLFVCSDVGEAEKVAAIKKFKNSSVLLVGEESRFAHRGGKINLTADDNRIRIEINLEISKQAGLEISSKLLGIAEIVTGL